MSSRPTIATTTRATTPTPRRWSSPARARSAPWPRTRRTAPNQGRPFGFTMAVPGSATINGYTNCQGAPAGNYNGIPGAYNVTNAEGPSSASTQSLYTGTTQSVNTFYAELEKKVGLCNVVNTAVNLGMTRVDGTSLLKNDGTQYSADNIPSFTLGSVNVSPLSMAAAYATVAARG